MLELSKAKRTKKRWEKIKREKYDKKARNKCEEKKKRKKKEKKSNIERKSHRTWTIRLKTNPNVVTQHNRHLRALCWKNNLKFFRSILTPGKPR
jgi:hypothetical protein